MGICIKYKEIKMRIPAPVSDAWHLFKSAMIICLIAAVIRAYYSQPPTVEWWLHFICIGVLWDIVFWLFYHKILRIK